MDVPLAEKILFWILFPIVIIILLIIMLAAARIAFCKDLPKRTYDMDLSKLRTGDILGVGYTHPFGWFVKAWFNSTWNHTGIVWVDPEDAQIYVLEAAMYHGEYKGVIKIPIVQWIRCNRKYYVGIAKLRGKKVDPTELMEAFKKRQEEVQLESYNWRWYRLLLTSPYKEEKRSNYTCYEITISVLQDIGVVEKKYACSSYSPKEIMKGKIHLTEGYKLKSVKLLDVSHSTCLRQCEDGSNSTNKGGCSRCSGSWSYD